ncbi:type II toxin-antitoxin system death-on-curing family toxin [Curtobacterium pusillum]|uniref:Type II toxin-antitoxin system death-on-curing family toxin n=1 Tax=Curtobacterium pusillum TaxID=69373 RepID=A0ABX2M2T5_9MICO|nr:type II toxin-antitoxin system death-on-curing family toxin [Curtobacterium pusillum]NUU12465.1 type II toxin-antitoxin system death-on-curing family toxin [Curtobacterium pusillum]GLK33146.1 toxin Doc [Curtobacterium pusillum]
MIHLTTDEALHVARRTLGDAFVLRDVGLLEAAVARAATSVGGQDAYPSVLEKAAALVHSVVRNHALVDGNERLGLMLLVVFLGVNGRRLSANNDEAYELIVAIADGRLDSVPDISDALTELVEAAD